MKTRYLLVSTPLLVAAASIASDVSSIKISPRELVILQPSEHALMPVAYETSVQVNGDLWFRVGPFRAGEPLVAIYRPDSNTPPSNYFTTIAQRSPYRGKKGD